MPSITPELPTPSTIDTFHLLASDLHTVANYSQLVDECDRKGTVLEESKEFYSDRAINALALLFQGKTKEEIAVALRDLYAMM